jgi:hypothetical protein
MRKNARKVDDARYVVLTAEVVVKALERNVRAGEEREAQEVPMGRGEGTKEG